MVEIVPHWIGGEPVTPEGGVGYEVYNPATGRVIAKGVMADAGLCHQTVQSAMVARQTWSRMPPVKRAQILFQFRALLVQNQATIAALVTKEQGKTLADATEIGRASCRE